MALTPFDPSSPDTPFAKTVSTSAPTSGDGNDGDFWFVRET